MNNREFSIAKLKEIEINLEKTIKKIDKLYKSHYKVQIIDNADFIQLMQISSSTAKNWRNKGVIPYSQIENKIYYKIEDIQEVLENKYRGLTSKRKIY